MPRESTSANGTAATILGGKGSSNETDAYPERTVDILLMGAAQKTD